MWGQAVSRGGGRQRGSSSACPPRTRLGPAAVLTVAILRILGVVVVLHRILRVLILIVLGGHPACTQGGPGSCCPSAAHAHAACPCSPTHPGGPAVLTFLLCVRDLEHRHEATLGASGVCSVTREGSWGKEQGYRALGSLWRPPQSSPAERTR